MIERVPQDFFEWRSEPLNFKIKMFKINVMKLVKLKGSFGWIMHLPNAISSHKK